MRNDHCLNYMERRGRGVNITVYVNVVGQGEVNEIGFIHFRVCDFRLA